MSASVACCFWACDLAPAPSPRLQASTTPTGSAIAHAEVAPAVGAGTPALPDELPPPLRTESWIVELEVPGFGNALVVPPQGIRTPRPVLVALHGYADRPDWQCGAWTGVTRAAVFVVCPRGIALPKPPGNFAFGSLLDTEREVFAVLAALQARFSAYLGPERVLVGYSLGAQRAAQLAERNPKRFPRVALVEGGTGEWSTRASRRFKEGGGERLLLVCSQLGCEALLRALARQSLGPHTEVRAEYLGPLGHTLGPQATAKLKEPWRWLADGLLTE